MPNSTRMPAAAATLSLVLLLGGCGVTSASTSTVTIVAAGDIGDCGDEPAASSAAARTAALVTPGDALVLTLGDSTYPAGAHTEFANCFHPTWGVFRERIRPSAGNHDYYTPGAEGYFNYFGAQAGPDRRGYYSFDLGGWHFISLDSNVDVAPGSAQYLWLAQDLASSRAALCTIAYWHHPVFSSGPHGNVPRMVPIFDALQAAGADIVLSGHDHGYERFAPQNADGVANPARGIREFVVGTGGARLYPLNAARPQSEARIEGTHGVLRLTLGQNGYRWQFAPVGGGPALDEGQDLCHR